jgi:hypothetical protein
VEVFDKLVAFPSLLTHPNLTIEVLLLREDHVRGPHATTRRRRTRDPGERRLVEPLGSVELRTPEDVIAALPPLPEEPFSTRELATLLGCGTVLAQRTVYCLRAIGLIEAAGMRGRAPLHAAVKDLLARPGDRAEVPVGRFVIDLVRADGELVEVQTGGFGALGKKLDALLDEHRIRVVHPVAAECRIVRVDEHGEVLGARRSPKRATAVAVFDKLVAFPSLLTHPNLTIEVLLLREDHIRGPHPTTTRRRTRDPGERRLVDVLDRVVLRTPEDIVAALPALPPEPFSTRELAAVLRCSTMLAQRTLYCLRIVGIVEPAGKRGRTPLHARTLHIHPAR